MYLLKKNERYTRSRSTLLRIPSQTRALGHTRTTGRSLGSQRPPAAELSLGHQPVEPTAHAFPPTVLEPLFCLGEYGNSRTSKK